MRGDARGQITVRYETIKRLRLASTPSQSLRTRHKLHHEYAPRVAYGLAILKGCLVSKFSLIWLVELAALKGQTVQKFGRT